MVYRILLILLLILMPIHAFSWQDKAMHTLTSFTLVNVGYLVCKNHLDENITDNECLAMAVGASIIARMIKESVIDSQPDYTDYAANFVGIGIAIPFIYLEY